MLASKHTIYLTKKYQLNGDGSTPTNVFMFNENGRKLQAKWIRKTIDMNAGSFVILDHNNTILHEAERGLTKRNYYIEAIDFSDMKDKLSINPFDLVKDTSEIHFMFFNILHAVWDNADPDITAMSNLIDAFASCTYSMFKDRKDKLNMDTMKKMVYSVRANCQTDNGTVMLSDAIFAGMKDQNSMPCKYYAQFKRAAGERVDEIAEKVAQVFDRLNENDMEMMSVTDESLLNVFNFKTAVFVNVNSPEEEHSAKIMITLLNYFIQRLASHQQVLFVLDDLDAKYNFASLPHWMKEAPEYDASFIVINNDLSEFKATPMLEKYFKNLQKQVGASILVHHDDNAIKYAEELPMNRDDMNEFMDQEFIATVLIPTQGISDQDELF